MSYRPVEILKDEAVLRELQRLAQALEPVYRNNFRVLAVAPEKPQDGDSAVCDGVHWDPLGDGVKRPVWYDAEVAIWKSFAVVTPP